MSAARSIVQVVCTDAFAGVERYVTDVAVELTRRGHRVTVVGGDAGQMRAALDDGVEHRPGSTVRQTAQALWQLGRQDVVHAHMTAAETAAWPLKGIRYDRLVVTRHFASRRGSSVGGLAVRHLIGQRVDAQISISHFVAAAIGEPSTVLYNGVPTSTQPALERSRSVVMLQRLEREKQTDVGIRAWAESGLAADGWRLRIFGEGSQQSTLAGLAADLGVGASVSFEGFTAEPRRILAEAGLVLATAPAEPFGLTVVEAMAEGTAVVASDGGAHPETLGRQTPLFAAGDAAAAADLLRRAAADSSGRDESGALLRRRHAELFTIQAHCDRLEEIYEAALAPERP